MELRVLAVPDCPHLSLLLGRLAQVLPEGAREVPVRVVTTEAEAARLGMHGSPTLLVDGLDPFAPRDAPTGVACRVYRAADGHAEGAPSMGQLASALERAGMVRG
ncbi:hypothetical protein ACFPM3_12225 [Streptomyces coeruleoprunus]|uniref:Alkylmercury lyase n=1 Tax=Streptomyces coeruleoprunus TaxID=285563 RepID=A0ABV9XDR4_9ACTN